VRLQIVFAVFQSEFLADFGSMKLNGPDGKTHDFGAFFVGLTLPDQVGDPNLFGGQFVFKGPKSRAKGGVISAILVSRMLSRFHRYS
jgi:hypothetical protein